MTERIVTVLEDGQDKVEITPLYEDAEIVNRPIQVWLEPKDAPKDKNLILLELDKDYSFTTEGGAGEETVFVCLFPKLDFELASGSRLTVLIQNIDVYPMDAFDHEAKAVEAKTIKGASVVQEFPGDAIVSMIEFKDNIYLATNRGVYKLNQETGVFEPLLFAQAEEGMAVES